MLLYWVWYAQLAGISLAQKLELLRHFRDPEEIYHCSQAQFASVNGITAQAISALENKNLSPARSILEDCAEKGIGIVAYSDCNYPPSLRNIYEAPLVLYVKGTLPRWKEAPIIGIVGTRKATPYGLNMAQRFGAQIGACGAVVASGGAEGIDTMAMLGALECEGTVVCVLGCGVDVVYPKENKALFAKVEENGCLISEYPPKARPAKWTFPARNRIISGISNGLLVVEAPKGSGALITANRAMEQGKDVFVVPGNVDVETCAGSNALLQDRAFTALSGWDVVKEYAFLYPGKVSKKQIPDKPLILTQNPAIPIIDVPQDSEKDKKSIDKHEKSSYIVLDEPKVALSEAEKAFIMCIPDTPISVDELIAQLQQSAATVKTMLTKLTMKRLVVNHPGGRISRK